MQIRILNTIGPIYTAEAKKILNKIGKVDYFEFSNQEELMRKIPDYDVVVTGLGLNFNPEIIQAGKKLKIIATATTGTDHIDLDYARKKGIEVLCLKNDRKFLDTVTGTAELAFLLMLSLMRNLLPATKSASKHVWTEKFRGHNLYGKTLGIVGLGRLGSMMARFGNAFGMKVVAYDPYVKNEVFINAKCRKLDFTKLLKTSDVISIHVHLNKKTQNMFGKETFNLMKNTAYLVNTSRGKVVNEKDLLQALKEKRIAGYGTDVLADELSFNEGIKNNAIIDYAKKNSNVIITPHVGGVTFESREATDIFTAKKVLKEVIKLKI